MENMIPVILLVYNILRYFISKYDVASGYWDKFSACKFLVAQISILYFQKTRYLKSKAI